MNEVQKITVKHGTQDHWFEVYRYDTQTELHAALHSAGIKFGPHDMAHTDCYKKPSGECGRMYLLDKSVNTLATAASAMAFNIALETGQIEIAKLVDDVSALTGQITSELYSKNRHY